MDELLQQIQSACAGLSADEIASQIRASQFADAIPDVEVLAAFLEAVGGVVPDTADQAAPDQEETEPNSGND
jgi:hypothetical protein